MASPQIYLYPPPGSLRIDTNEHTHDDDARDGYHEEGPRWEQPKRRLTRLMALFTLKPFRIPKPRLVVYGSLLFLLCILGLLIGKPNITSFKREEHGGWEVEADVGGSNTQTPRILLVTALYPLKRSKHSDSDYAWWLYLFLSRIQTDTYFYGPERMRATIEEQAARLDSPRQFTLNTTYPGPFSVPPLLGLENEYEAMHAKDREKSYHGAELYAIWNAKAFFLDEAVNEMRRAGKQYDYVFWIDAGSFRQEHAYTAWPDPKQVDNMFRGHPARMFFSLQGPPNANAKGWTEDMGPVDDDVSQGSFFGGPPATVSWFRKTFYAYHNHYLFDKSYFVGKDQTVFNAIIMLFPSRFLTIWMRDPDAPAAQALRAELSKNGLKSKLMSSLGFLTNVGALGRCHDDWYYYHFYFAPEAAREKMRDMWDAEDIKNGSWWKSALGLKNSWWVRSTRCRVADNQKMEDVLRARFGEDWKVPASSLFPNQQGL